MKQLIEIKYLKENHAIYKEILNFGLYTQFFLKKQLGLSLNKENIKIDLNFEIKNEFFLILSYYHILDLLILDLKYYLRMYKYYTDLFENKTFLKKTIRLRMGLPVNGQRSRTNSKNARKKFYTKFLKRIVF